VPFYQTKRFDRYKDVIEELLAGGQAYRVSAGTVRRTYRIQGHPPYLGLVAVRLGHIRNVRVAARNRSVTGRA
jgi:glutamyl/glutaminyl-tRNA synthetase